LKANPWELPTRRRRRPEQIGKPFSASTDGDGPAAANVNGGVVAAEPVRIADLSKNQLLRLPGVAPLVIAAMASKDGQLFCHAVRDEQVCESGSRLTAERYGAWPAYCKAIQKARALAAKLPQIQLPAPAAADLPAAAGIEPAPPVDGPADAAGGLGVPQPIPAGAPLGGPAQDPLRGPDDLLDVNAWLSSAGYHLDHASAWVRGWLFRLRALLLGTFLFLPHLLVQFFYWWGRTVVVELSQAGKEAADELVKETKAHANAALGGNFTAATTFVLTVGSGLLGKYLRRAGA
jgi:hypothetical protein